MQVQGMFGVKALAALLTLERRVLAAVLLVIIRIPI